LALQPFKKNLLRTRRRHYVTDSITFGNVEVLWTARQKEPPATIHSPEMATLHVPEGKESIIERLVGIVVKDDVGSNKAACNPIEDPVGQGMIQEIRSIAEVAGSGKVTTSQTTQ